MAQGVTLKLREFVATRQIYVPRRDGKVVELPHGRGVRTYIDSPKGMRRIK